MVQLEGPYSRVRKVQVVLMVLLKLDRPVPYIYIYGGMKGWAWGRSTKVPHNRASRPQYAGAPDKAERSVETYNEGQVRACDLPTR